MGQPRASCRLIPRHPNGGGVMVALSETEEGLDDLDQPHAKGVGVELDGPLGGPHSPQGRSIPLSRTKHSTFLLFAMTALHTPDVGPITRQVSTRKSDVFDGPRRLTLFGKLVRRQV